MLNTPLSRRSLLLTSAASIVLPLGASRAHAQGAANFPNRPITLVVPFAAGTATDIGARLFAKGLADELKQSVVIDNRPGGGAMIGTEFVARAVPDGYTLLYLGGGSLSQTFFSRKMPVDLTKDLAPVIQLGRGDFFLHIRGDLPVRNVQEFIAMLRAEPGKYNYASIASTQMLPMEMLLHKANVRATHVAYKSPGQVQQAFAAGDIVATVNGDVGYEGFLQAGKMRRLMVFGDERAPQAPEVPTAAESGLAGLRSPFSFAIWAPGQVTPDIIAKLNTALNAVIPRPDVQDFFKRQGGASTGGAARVQLDYVKGEHAYWAEAARVSKFSPE